MTVVDPEPREVMERNLNVAARLWSSATVFFFFAFFFAYFYLRSLNNSHLWKPKHVDVPGGWGIAVTLCVVAGAVLLHLAKANRAQWRPLGLGTLALGLVAVGLQIAAWATIGFGPASGGYASVYLGWTGLYTLFVFVSLYWLETCLVAKPDSDTNAAQLEALSFYWSVLAGVGVVTWIVLYLL